ncbi:MAG: nitroreductase family protein [Bacteroidales bacterium]|nr:MAG: nitroreductase family protein [Bacteroidales bacterium]
MLKELVLKNRSYRRFDQSIPISKDNLLDFIDLARNSASGRNLQTLKYFVSNEPILNSAIFPTLSWAGYIKDWDGPIDGEKPSGYIVMLEDTQIGKNLVHDQGIAAQTILLAAVEKGFGGCMIYSVKRSELAVLLHLPTYLEIVLVIALGVPIEQVVIEQLQSNEDIKYWRDENQVHHVPKRNLKDIVINY